MHYHPRIHCVQNNWNVKSFHCALPGPILIIKQTPVFTWVNEQSKKRVRTMFLNNKLGCCHHQNNPYIKYSINSMNKTTKLPTLHAKTNQRRERERDRERERERERERDTHTHTYTHTHTHTHTHRVNQLNAMNLKHCQYKWTWLHVMTKKNWQTRTNNKHTVVRSWKTKTTKVRNKNTAKH